MSINLSYLRVRKREKEGERNREREREREKRERENGPYKNFESEFAMKHSFTTFPYSTSACSWSACSVLIIW